VLHLDQGGVGVDVRRVVADDGLPIVGELANSVTGVFTTHLSFASSFETRGASVSEFASAGENAGTSASVSRKSLFMPQAFPQV